MKRSTISAEEWVRGDVHTNSIEGVWSLFKRSIVGSYHQISTKHMDAYLDEFEWRFNQRDNQYLFRDTMLACWLHRRWSLRNSLINPLEGLRLNRADGWPKWRQSREVDRWARSCGPRDEGRG